MNWYDCSLLPPMEIQNLIEGAFREKISILEVEQWYSNRVNEFVGSIDDGMFFVLDVMTDAMLTFSLTPVQGKVLSMFAVDIYSDREGGCEVELRPEAAIHAFNVMGIMK